MARQRLVAAGFGARSAAKLGALSASRSCQRPL